MRWLAGDPCRRGGGLAVVRGFRRDPPDAGKAWLPWIRRVAAVALGAWAAAVGAIELTTAETAGKRIFTEGVSPSGAALSARIGAAGTPIPASVVPCANCHGRDGRGRPEGGVRPSDITWRRLSAPGGQLTESGREHPPYDEAALARAVTLGVDPAGNRLDPAMPRFVMSMRDLADLAAYLKRIEDDHDPGLAPDTIRIGTLLPGEGPLAEAARTVAGVLRGAFDEVNDAGGIHGRRLELVTADSGADRDAAERAMRALAAGNAFALVAPLAPSLEGGWGRLADSAGLPTVGPIGLRSEGAGSRYVFDPLAGLQEQALALGEFAASGLRLENPVAAVLHDGEARDAELAQALASRLGRHGWSRVEVVQYPGGEAGSERAAAPLAARGVQAVFHLGGSDDFAALARALDERGVDPYLFAPAARAAAAALQLPTAFSGRAFLAFPTLPRDWTPAGGAALDAVRRRGGLDGRQLALQVRAYAAAQVLVEGLKRAGRDASRDKLVTALERLYDFRTGLTPPIGFAPGLRVGAPGAHLVAVDLDRRTFRPAGPFQRVGGAPQ